MTELETKLAEALRAAKVCPQGWCADCDAGRQALAEYDAQAKAEPCMHERAAGRCGRCGVELAPEGPKAPPGCTCPYVLSEGQHYPFCALADRGR